MQQPGHGKFVAPPPYTYRDLLSGKLPNDVCFIFCFIYKDRRVCGTGGGLNELGARLIENGVCFGMGRRHHASIKHMK